jgi:oxygen-independent coproporphyrinogen-3 oxidase
MLGLYIHIPFCRKKCNYCDFISQIAESSKISEYLKAVNIEAKKYLGFQISTIYVGGGTPSILNENQIKELFNNFKNIFDLKKEIGLFLTKNTTEVLEIILGGFVNTQKKGKLENGKILCVILAREESH